MIAQISEGVDVLLDGAGAPGGFGWLGRGFTVGRPLQQDLVDVDDQVPGHGHLGLHATAGLGTEPPIDI